MRVLSLFSGIGGIDLSAHYARMETVAFCEKERFCQRVLEKHWPNVPIYRDIQEITKEQLELDGVINHEEKIDIIAGGFPCQPFSVAGKRRGKKDDRYLWPEMLRVVQELRPHWIIGENVAGLVRLGLDDVLTDLEREGYATRTFVFPASAVGAPHQRQRVWIVGYYDPCNVSNVAHSHCIRCNGGKCIRKNRPIQGYAKWNFPEDQPKGNRVWDGISSNDQTVGSSSYKRLERKKISNNTKERDRNHTGHIKPIHSQNVEENGGDQSHLGGVLNGIPDQLDDSRWPAFLGQAQFGWEPKKIAMNVEDRNHRLKALGNAVVPAQCYPILKAIYEVNREMYK